MVLELMWLKNYYNAKLVLSWVSVKQKINTPSIYILRIIVAWYYVAKKSKLVFLVADYNRYIYHGKQEWNEKKSQVIIFNFSKDLRMKLQKMRML